MTILFDKSSEFHCMAYTENESNIPLEFEFLVFFGRFSTVLLLLFPFLKGELKITWKIGTSKNLHIVC